MKRLLLICPLFTFCSSCATSDNYLGKPVNAIYPIIYKNNPPIAVHIIQTNDIGLKVLKTGDIDVGKTVVKGLTMGGLGLLLFGPERTPNDPELQEKVAKLERSFKKTSNDYLLKTLEERMKLSNGDAITYDRIDLLNGRADYSGNNVMHFNFVINHYLIYGKNLLSGTVINSDMATFLISNHLEDATWPGPDDVMLSTALYISVITDDRTQYLYVDSLSRNRDVLPRCGDELHAGQYLGTVNARPKYIRKDVMFNDDGRLLEEQMQSSISETVEKFMASLKSQNESIIRYRCLR